MYRTITNRKETKENVIKDYLSGISIKEIVEKNNIGMKTVYRFVSDFKKRNNEITDSVANKISELYEKNKKISEIRAETGLCNRSIYKALRKKFIEPNRHKQ